MAKPLFNPGNVQARVRSNMYALPGIEEFCMPSGTHVPVLCLYKNEGAVTLRTVGLRPFQLLVTKSRHGLPVPRAPRQVGGGSVWERAARPNFQLQ